MSPKIRYLDARVSRAVAPDVKHTSIYSEVVYTTFICKICFELGYYSEAYLESGPRRKHENHIREYHASCYNESNGRIAPRPEAPQTILPIEVTEASIGAVKTRKTKKIELPTTTLELFFMESDNA